MRETNVKPAAASRYREAARWHIHFRQALAHGNKLSESEAVEAVRFFADTENREALTLAARVSSHFCAVPAIVDTQAEIPDDSEYDGDVSVEEWRRDLAERTARRRWRRVGVFVLATAASLAAVAMGFQYLHASPSHAQLAGRVFRTGAAHNEHILLSDGSQVTLGAQSEMIVRFDTRRRLVVLTRGEALFAIEQDRSRPFTVNAGFGAVTALGTQFDVRHDLDRVTVTVTEGSVFVEPTTEAPRSDPDPRTPAVKVKWEPVRVEHGQKVTYDESHDRGSVETADLGATEWTAGRFQYRDVPLKYIIADINRYRQSPIVLKDAAAGEYAFTGTVFLDHTGEWLLSLERILPLSVSEKEDRVSIASRSTP